MFLCLISIQSNMNRLGTEELADINFFYGRANGNAAEVRRLYMVAFPDSRIPCERIFTENHRKLREHGSFHAKNEGGRERFVRTVDVEEDILHRIDENPRTSTRLISREIGVSHCTVWRTLHKNLLYSYHIQRVQGLSPADFEPRLRFYRWLLVQCTENPQFTSFILFSDEANFARDAITNYHNNHV